MKKTIALVATVAFVACAPDDANRLATSNAHLGKSTDDGLVIAGIDGVVSARPGAPAIVRPIPAETLAELRRRKSVDGEHVAPAAEVSRVAAALERAAALPAGESLLLTVTLPDVEWDPSPLRSAEDLAQRESIIEARLEQLRPSQTLFAVRIAKLGAVVVDRLWLANQVVIKLPAGRAAELAALPEIVGLDAGGSGTVVEGLAYSGLESRAAVRASNLIAAGFDGSYFDTSLKFDALAVIEVTLPVPHQAFRRYWDCGGGPFPPGTICQQWRYNSIDCSSGTCVIVENPTSTTVTHASKVAWVAAGSIEHGEDPAFPGSGTTEQLKRSGTAPRAGIRAIKIGSGGEGFAAAINWAVARAKVINISLASSTAGPDLCNPTLNAALINAPLAAAVAAGTLPVACAGNGGHASSCNVWHPAVRSEVLSVNGLNTDPSTTAYSSTSLLTTASRGGVQLKRWDGVTGSSWKASRVDLAAPGAFDFFASNAPASYEADPLLLESGCSFAAPVVTGGALLHRRAWQNYGGVAMDARYLLVNMLVMGDGWNGADTGAVYMKEGVSDLSGYGRLKLHSPSSSDMGPGYWEWGVHSATLSPGMEACWYVGHGGALPGTKLWKFAATWFESDYNAVADIDATVYNHCAGSPLPRVLMATDVAHDMRLRLRLTEGEILGRCMMFCVDGASIPPGQTRTVYTADYFTQQDPSLH